MFQQTFVPDVPTGRKPIGVVVSLVAQSLLISLLILVPLIVSQPLPTAQLKSLLIGPATPIAPEKPVAHTASVSQRSLAPVHLFRLTSPVVVPKQIDTPSGEMTGAPSVETVPGSDTGGDSLVAALGGSSIAVAPPIPKAQPQIRKPAGPIALGGNVASANLIHRVEPSYPPLAKAARIRGEVVFNAVIGIDGQIRNLQLQEGHPLLVAAARTAILQWRYRPTLLNGKPVEVVTTITVYFEISQ